MTDLYGGVLCAGYGSRLAPLTDAIPKPLIPFLNTPIVAYALERLAAADVTRVAVNTHHLADALPPVIDRLAAAFGVKPVYVHEWEILGSGGGIRGLLRGHNDPEDGTLVVLNGDSVMDFDLRRAIRAHHASGRLVTLVTRPRADDQPGGVFVDAAGQLQGVRHYRRPAAPPDSLLREHDFTGVHIADVRAIARLPLEKVDVIDTLYGPMLEQREAIGVFEVDGFWAALDTPKLLLQTSSFVLRDPTRFNLAPLPQPHADGMWFYNPANIADDAKFAPPVFLGANVVVEKGASIGPNVVADGVTIRAGARVSNAILYGMGDVEGEWVDCVAVAGKVVSTV